VIGASWVAPVPTGAFEGFIEIPAVEFILRVTNPPRGKTLSLQLRNALHDKRGYQLDGLRVEESMEVRGFQPLGSDEQSFNYSMEFTFLIV
jgi:hypothetical protein